LFNAFTCPECGVRLEVPKDSRSFVQDLPPWHRSQAETKAEARKPIEVI